MTSFELSWGAYGVVEPAQKRIFQPFNQNDAVTRFAERVVELDRNPRVSAGWVHLKKLDTLPERETWIASWTKTSDERPTEEGEPA